MLLPYEENAISKYIDTTMDEVSYEIFNSVANHFDLTRGDFTPMQDVAWSMALNKMKSLLCEYVEQNLEHSVIQDIERFGLQKFYALECGVLEFDANDAILHANDIMQFMKIHNGFVAKSDGNKLYVINMEAEGEL